MKPAKTHGNSVKNTNEAKDSYDSRNNMVNQFLQKIPNLKHSVKTSLINYYETK